MKHPISSQRRGFTLIELLVVIAIIAILAAILFPVFAQAKAAAKKTQGLAQAKQIGLATQLYMDTADDNLMPYRFVAATAEVNPTYLKLKAANDPRAATMKSQGATTIKTVFFSDMLEPFCKSKDIFKSPGNSEAWSGYQDKGTWDSGFHSYGGQNSYGANTYLLKPSSEASPAAPTSQSSIAEVSNTLLFVDATYYNVLPAMPGGTYCQLNGVTFGSPAGYTQYWKHLGNNKHNFNNPGNNDPDNATNAPVIQKIESRFSGQLNVVRADSSAKALTAKTVIYDLRSKGKDSFWNPGKTACE